ncbi:MAG: PilZ domain-containing protein [Proteobacteria bacterium]|nr:PilZ domain-containing protein [Pseudomonadota bacterium]
MDRDDTTLGSAEHRAKNRVRSFLRAEIIHSNGNSRTECIVRDLSDTGARIEAPTSVTVPEFFELHIPLKGIRQRSRMMWRAGVEMGVAFVVEAPAPTVAPVAKSEGEMELRIRLLELEAETARMRLQLTEMQLTINTLVKERGVA